MADKELAEWAALGRSITDDDRIRHEPPPAIWDNIAATIAADEAFSIAPRQIQDEAPSAPVIDLTSQRAARGPGRRQHRLMLLAGAAAVVLFVFGLSLFTGGEDEPEVLFAADVSNATMPEAFDGTATATIADPDAPILEIDFEGMLPSDEPVELWLIKDDLSDMRSLGIVDPSADSWTGDWPADLDPTEFSVVDLSIEPDDGNPAHSGRSILRGQLIET